MNKYYHIVLDIYNHTYNSEKITLKEQWGKEYKKIITLSYLAISSLILCIFFSMVGKIIYAIVSLAIEYGALFYANKIENRIEWQVKIKLHQKYHEKISLFNEGLLQQKFNEKNIEDLLLMIKNFELKESNHNKELKDRILGFVYILLGITGYLSKEIFGLLEISKKDITLLVSIVLLVISFFAIQISLYKTYKTLKFYKIPESEKLIYALQEVLIYRESNRVVSNKRRRS